MKKVILIFLTTANISAEYGASAKQCTNSGGGNCNIKPDSINQISGECILSGGGSCTAEEFKDAKCITSGGGNCNINSSNPGIDAFCAMSGGGSCNISNYNKAACIGSGGSNCTFINVDEYDCITDGNCGCSGGKCVRNNNLVQNFDLIRRIQSFDSTKQTTDLIKKTTIDLEKLYDTSAQKACSLNPNAQPVDTEGKAISWDTWSQNFYNAQNNNQQNNQNQTQEERYQEQEERYQTQEERYQTQEERYQEQEQYQNCSEYIRWKENQIEQQHMRQQNINRRNYRRY